MRLLADLEDMVVVCGTVTPNIRDLFDEMRAVLEQPEEEQNEELQDLVDLLPVPFDSLPLINLDMCELLAGLGKEKLSSVWFRHAGKRYHMQWGNDGDIEVSFDNAIKIRLERMRDGIRLRFLPL